jgi:subtilisin family serine protease
MTRAIAARALLAAATALAAAVSLTAPASATSAEGQATAGASERPVRVIVTYDSLANRPSVARSVDRLGTVTRTMKRSAHLVAKVPASDLERLRRSPHVRAVQVDVPERLALDSSTKVIHADTAHAAGWTGAGTTVAILDTGVDLDHPFLGGRVIAQYCSSDPDPSEPAQESLCPNGSSTDDSADIDSLPACSSASGPLCDHGTHVAGIAAGNGSGVAGAPVAGVAPGANIIAMQVFTRFNGADVCGTGQAPCVASYQSDQMAALDELAALDTAHPSWNIVAANLSLGGGGFSAACDTDARKHAVDTLLAQGVATVIAAGNDSFGAKVSTPGCISSAVTVGATNDSDSVASYSNRGKLLDVFAPGSSITSSVPDDGWATYNGTSMATPHVVGALALMRQHTPWRSIASLVADLKASGKAVSYGSGGVTVTTRRIDVTAALAANHAPSVAVTGTPAAAPEGSALTVSGTWGDADGDAVTVTASTGTLTKGAGSWTWTATARGDDTSLPVTITATDAVNGTRTVPFTARWANVAPTATLQAAATTWNGAQLTTAGALTTVSVKVTDPGSDDISTAWNYGDGTQTFTRSLLHPPTVDPAASPSVEPRAFTRTVSHTYTQACTRTVSVRASDDDGGASPNRSRPVVVLGTSTTRRSLAWWSSEYRGLTSNVRAADRTCLLSTARALSTVFVEKRALTTTADAVAVLRPASPTTARSRLDAQLLAVWLDVAIGAVDLGDPLDSDLSGSPDTTVGAFLASTEATRNASSASSSALAPLTTVLARISTTG